MSHRKAVSEIRFDIQQIDLLLETYRTLLDECREKEPNLIEITATVSVLHFEEEFDKYKE
ncbi:hypothetical protein H8E77_31295 [bacterium]|nr:hypothetical protein [bacterium]